MSNLNISGRRIVSAKEVDDMIKAVDDGDGKLDFDEFVQLIQKRTWFISSPVEKINILDWFLDFR